jgi:hypothetical protein
MKNANRYILFMAMALGLNACARKMEHPAMGGSPGAPNVNGIYVLAEGGTTSNGGINGNDSGSKSTLAFYDPATKTVTPDRFSQVNGFPLGFRASDMGLYGSKLYIVLGGSQAVAVVDAASARQLARTPTALPDTLQAFTPNTPVPTQICFFDGEAYIGLLNGIIEVMDTSSMKIVRYLGGNIPLNDPIGPVVANGKLFFAGQGNGYPNLAIIDPRTGSLIRALSIYLNPESISADNSGNVYVQTQFDTAQLDFGAFENYQALTAGLTVVSSTTDQVVYQSSSTAAGSPSIVVSGNTGYYISGIAVEQFNAATLSFHMPNYNTGDVQLENITALTADPITGQLFVGDGKFTNPSNGTVDVFGDQQLQYSFPAGTNPIKIVLTKVN